MVSDHRKNKIDFLLLFLPSPNIIVAYMHSAIRQTEAQRRAVAETPHFCRAWCLLG